VFDLLVNYEVAELGYRDGVTEIKNIDAFVELTGLERDEFLSDALGFELDSGSRVVAWPTSLKALHSLVTKFADTVAKTVEKEEAKAQHESIHGSNYRGGHVSAEICREVDEEHGIPVRDVLRRWCGVEALDRAEELAALRDEVRRIGLLAAEAIDRLERSGDKSAAELRRRLGVPIDDLDD